MSHKVLELYDDYVHMDTWILHTVTSILSSFLSIYAWVTFALTEQSILSCFGGSVLCKLFQRLRANLQVPMYANRICFYCCYIKLLRVLAKSKACR